MVESAAFNADVHALFVRAIAIVTRARFVSLGGFVLGAGAATVLLDPRARSALGALGARVIDAVGALLSPAPRSPADTDDAHAERGASDDSSAAIRALVEDCPGFERSLAIAVGLSTATKIFDMAPPLLIGAAIDIVTHDGSPTLTRLGVRSPARQLGLLGLTTATVWALESLFEYGQQLAWSRLSARVQSHVRIKVYAHIQSLDIEEVEHQRTGALLSTLTRDVKELEHFLAHGPDSITQVTASVGIMGAIVLALAPGVLSFQFLPVPALAVASLWFQRSLRERYDDVGEESTRIADLLANNLGGLRTIKSFSTEELELRRVTRQNARLEAAQTRASRFASAYSPGIRAFVLVGFLGTLLRGGALVRRGELSVGSYTVMVYLTQRFLWPLTFLGETFDQYQRAEAAARSIQKTLALTPRHRDGGTELALSDVRGEFRFEHVAFAYRRGTTVLADVDVTFPAGKKTAVVGATGSGKSTIVDLLLRLHEPSAGRITLDGVDVRTLTSRSLRRAIAVVSQDVFLFHGTVRDNIAYARPDATAEDVRRAAEFAEAHTFIEAMPDGYDTVVGERGSGLSGGERQRIALARALLKDAPIVVFDEATSALDARTESSLLDNLATALRGRTVIVIAHKPRALADADLVHVLADGTIVESGSPAELRARGGAFAALERSRHD